MTIVSSTERRGLDEITCHLNSVIVLINKRVPLNFLINSKAAFHLRCINGISATFLSKIKIIIITFLSFQLFPIVGNWISAFLSNSHDKLFINFASFLIILIKIDFGTTQREALVISLSPHMRGTSANFRRVR